jgi:long-subunit fatty acid transport protein
MMKPVLIFTLPLVLLGALTEPARANIGDIYGFGSRSAALAGATVAGGFEAFSAYSNPAGLTRTGEKRLQLSWGYLDMSPSFLPIENVVVENNYTSDKRREGNVDTSYRDTFGQVLGLTYLIAPDFYRLSIGLANFQPMNQIAYVDSGETFEPEYFLYRARTQRPQYELGLGFQPASAISFGVGLHIAYSLTTNTSIFLQTDPTKPSTMRMAASMKPRVGPYFGAYYQSPDKHGDITAGAVLRLPVKSASEIVLKSGARALGPLVALDFNATAVSAMFYDPLSVELGTTWRYLRTLRLYLQADYQAWSKFSPPSILITDPQTENCVGTCTGVGISAGHNPSYSFQDILIPRLGNEWEITPSTLLRVGYYYRPSMLADLPTEAGNYLDPPKHAFNLGVGFKFAHFLVFEAPCSLDFHFSYQRLVTQQISKTPGNELGVGTGNDKIGAPGYVAGGKIYGGGVSVSLAL